ncbi:MAG: hypothetical protein N2Z22_08480 [Turneriella sp.]|nr:hypothetical protein [Turneriella sp.]
MRALDLAWKAGKPKIAVSASLALISSIFAESAAERDWTSIGSSAFAGSCVTGFSGAGGGVAFFSAELQLANMVSAQAINKKWLKPTATLGLVFIVFMSKIYSKPRQKAIIAKDTNSKRIYAKICNRK